MMLEIVKAGANAHGLKLIGDELIGYRFVPRGELAYEADYLLEVALNSAGDDGYSWLNNNRDGEYNSTEWNAKSI